MNRFKVLLKGEILRLYKYNLLGASLFVSLIWVGVLHFVDMKDVTMLIPQLVFIDVTTMAMLLIGVTFIYEKDESTIRSLLVSPISKSEYILAKLVAGIMPSIISLTIMYLYSNIFKEVHINYFLLLGGVILVAFFHSLIGFLLTYYSKSFTDLVMIITGLFLAFLLPVVLDEFGIIANGIFRALIYLLPTKSALMVIVGTTGAIKSWEIAISIVYMILGSAILYYLVWKYFERYSQKKSGE